MKKILSLLLIMVLSVWQNAVISPEITFASTSEEDASAGDGSIGFEDEAEYVCKAEDYTYSLSGAEISLQKYNGSDEKILVPSLIDGCTVTSISASCFEGNKTITDVKMPDTIKVIGERAFSKCSKLKNVALPDELIGISPFLFRESPALERITIPDFVKTISIGAFYKCTGLKEVIISDSVLEMNSSYVGYFDVGIFEGCTRLESVYLPKNLTKINKSTFSKCSALKDINIPDPVTCIGESAFSGCTSLTSINIPQRVKEIALGAFAGCSNLKEVHINDLESWCNIYFDYETIYYGYTDATVSRYNGANPLEHGGTLYINNEPLKHIEIPDKIEKINQFAFVGCTMESLYIPLSVSSVNYGAFEKCKNLIHVYLPDSITLNDTAPWGYTHITPTKKLPPFSECSSCVFYCNKNSETARYALDKQIPVIDIKYGMDYPESNLIYNATNYICAFDNISASGYLPLLINYQFKDGIIPSDICISVKIPSHVSYVENSTTVNGRLADVEYNEASAMLRIPTTETKGEVKFFIKPNAYGDISSSAFISYGLDGKTYNDVVGIVYNPLPVITINSDSAVSASTVKVRGLTLPLQSVALYVDNVYEKNVVANNLGEYYGNVTLPLCEDGKEYILSAKVSGEESASSADTTVKFVEKIPEITEIIMEHDGQKVDLTTAGDVRPIVIFSTTSDFKFLVRMNNFENVDRVFVKSIRNNVSKLIMAEWDENENAFVAVGKFGDGNTVPGDIEVDTIFRDTEITFDEAYENDIIEKVQKYCEDNTETMPEADVEIIESTEQKSSVKITFPNADDSSEVGEDNATSSFIMHVTREPIPEKFEQPTLHGYVEVTDREGNIQYIKSEIDKENNTIVTKIYEYCKKPDTVVQLVVDGADAVAKFVGSNVSYFSGLSVALTGAGIINDHLALENMRDSIRKQDLNMDAQAQINQEIDCAEVSSLMFSLAGFLVGTGGAAIVGAIKGAGFGACGVLIGSVVGMVTYIGTSSIQNTISHSIKQKAGQANFQVAPVRYGIDPSGYVYDIDTNERLQGVTATAYCIEYNSSIPDFYDDTPADNEYGNIWDAQEWGQQNPLTTDAEGRYSWDVPEGWWRVKYEKAGYETVWSHWMTVPPVQTDVNIGMTATEKPDKYVAYNSLTKTVTLTSNTAYSNASVHIAAYQNGKLIALKSKSQNIAIGDTSVVFSKFDSAGADTIKVMVWGTDSKIKPIFDIFVVKSK